MIGGVWADAQSIAYAAQALLQTVLKRHSIGDSYAQKIISGSFKK
jgi:hypothetical protein